MDVASEMGDEPATFHLLNEFFITCTTPLPPAPLSLVGRWQDNFYKVYAFNLFAIFCHALFLALAVVAVLDLALLRCHVFTIMSCLSLGGKELLSLSLYDIVR